MIMVQFLLGSFRLVVGNFFLYIKASYGFYKPTCHLHRLWLCEKIIVQIVSCADPEGGGAMGSDHHPPPPQ